ncbi:MAG: LolA family protein [Acidobacteriota bacterium]
MIRRTLGACLLCLGATALAQDPLPPGLRGAEKLDAIVQRVSEVQEKTTTLEAAFEQRRASRLLAEPSVSTGTFYYQAPDKVRWEYRTPRPMTMLVAGGVVLTYRPAEKRAERMEIGRAQRKVFHFLGAAEPLEELKRYFSFTFRDRGDGADYELVLTPTAMLLKRRLDSLTVMIGRGSFMPVAVSYVEKDGDSTAYLFRDIARNRPLPEDLFAVDLPADVEVVDIKLSDRQE